MRDDASRNKRQLNEVSNRMRRKSDEKNQLKREITELKNAQEEEETEVDTATYVSHLLYGRTCTCVDHFVKHLYTSLKQPRLFVAVNFQPMRDHCRQVLLSVHVLMA